MNKRRDALRRGVRALILNTSRELAVLEGRPLPAEPDLSGPPVEGPTPPATASSGAESGAAGSSSASAPGRPSGPPVEATPTTPVRAEEPPQMARPALRVPQVDAPARSPSATDHAAMPPTLQRRAPAAPPDAPSFSPLRVPPSLPAPTARVAPEPVSGAGDGQAAEDRPPAKATLPPKPPPSPKATLSPKAPRPAKAARPSKTAHQAKAARPSKTTHPPRASASLRALRRARRSRQRLLPDIPVDGADPQQAFSRTGVCFTYFVNNACWRVRDAYCNTALHMCIIRNCPVYHLHKEALERRFARKFEHLW